MATSTNSDAYHNIKYQEEGCGLIVETQKHGECTCHFDDSAYADKTQEDIDNIIKMFSAFVSECMRKKDKTA